MLHHVQLHYDITINIYHLFWLHTTNYSSLITLTNTDKNAVIWGLLAAAEDLVYVSVESIGLSFLVRFLTYYCHFMFQIRIPYYYCIIIFTYFEFPDLATATTDQQTSRASGQGREGRKKFWWDFSNFLWQVISRFISFRKINSKKYSFNVANFLWIIFHSLSTQSTIDTQDHIQHTKLHNITADVCLPPMFPLKCFTSV